MASAVPTGSVTQHILFTVIWRLQYLRGRSHNTFYLRLYGVCSTYGVGHTTHFIYGYMASAVPTGSVTQHILFTVIWRLQYLRGRSHNTFYLRLYGVRHTVKDHSDSERGNPLPPHGLPFPIGSKGSFICTIPQTG